MYYDVTTRTINMAEYIVDNKTTIRECAKYFKISKSTVHFDLQQRLPSLNKILYEKVARILNENFKEKHIRGGNATKNKYLKKL